MSAEQADKHGSRIERRRIWTSGELAGWRDWPGLKTACMIQRETWNRTPGSHQCETAYLISSLDHRQYDPLVFLKINREHWSIENKLHYVRDVTMGEDACRVRKGSAPQVLAGLRSAVIALARGDGWSNVAAALRYFAIKVHKALHLIGIAENEKTLEDLADISRLDVGADGKHDHVAKA